jgi:hypothetical protein
MEAQHSTATSSAIQTPVSLSRNCRPLYRTSFWSYMTCTVHAERRSYDASARTGSGYVIPLWIWSRQ